MGKSGLAAKKREYSCCLPPPRTKIIYLADLQSGEKGVVTALRGDEDFRGKMLPLGIVPGTNIEIINGGRGQPYILKVRETRLMLDWNIARKIAVSTVSSDG